ncbi:hypothetical protein [Frankia umida]|nr:hypothetical protein [Frankia umida]
MLDTVAALLSPALAVIAWKLGGRQHPPPQGTSCRLSHLPGE